jgi:plasmid stabilization system protein ParE
VTESLPVIVTLLAAKHIRQADEWWRVNRTVAPNAVWQEVERAFVLIAGQPRIGSSAKDVRLPGVQRILLPTIKYYLYYRVLAEPDRIEVVALWHRRRGSGPPI